MEERNRNVYNRTSVYTALKFSRKDEIIIKVDKKAFLLKNKTKQTAATTTKKAKRCCRARGEDV